MVISSFGIACRPQFYLRTPQFQCINKVQLNLVAAMEALDEPEGLFKDNKTNNSANGRNDVKAPAWKKLNSKELGITTSMIDKPTRKVLNGLKRKGYEVYLVGGCVRDLILKRTPKDFDIITSAELKEVTRTFSWCEIVGKRFPICHVHIGDTVVEVSSFSISARKYGRNVSADFGKPVHCDDKDYIRWRNCLQRDFTINGLMFDPYARIVYDYMGGMEDIRNAKVQTVIPASTSFREDCARILRAIRIAARLGFRISKETAHSVKNLSYSILRLDKGRLLMEMNYMLAYGSAEASLRLLWKFGLLELLLPIQVYTSRVAILAFHKALSEQPRDPLVVAAFSLAIHNGGDMLEAVNIARRITKLHDVSFNELSETQDLNPRALKDEVVNLATSLKRALNHMTDEQIVSEAMAGYPQAPYSDLVFIPWGLSLRVSRVFSCVTSGAERGFVPKQGSKIDYESLAVGNLPEVRHIFARVVFDTIYPLSLNRDNFET
ncbi:CCA-adding enzyme-like isoform X2 [Prunus dulcis]|uniref:CCA-adding enzyme-like isoform X2 n=1 Tax=Prunus dulcis TaxID=3755 RepID=UPI0014821DF1|nr:CCA-adding enzyme-like isoform X2 [Prunus dulcis]